MMFFLPIEEKYKISWVKYIIYWNNFLNPSIVDSWKLFRTLVFSCEFKNTQHLNVSSLEVAQPYMGSDFLLQDLSGSDTERPDQITGEKQGRLLDGGCPRQW